MAKDYLTLEEVCERLGKTAEQVRGLVTEGQLGEVRDGDAVFYKVAEVEQIAAKEGSSIVDLAAAEDIAPGAEEAESFASALSELADSSSGLGLIEEGPAQGATAEAGVAEAVPAEVSGAAPVELRVDDFPEDLPAAPKAPEPAELTDEIDLLPAEEGEAEEAAVAAVPDVPDLGLSGSSIISLEAAPDTTQDASKAAAAEIVEAQKKVGISVFDDDELEIESDPMGETHIAASVAELDQVGSGSGLLDLTRESDDTSLDPDLLEVISPSDAAETQTESDVDTVEHAVEEMEGAGAAEEPYEAAAAAAAAAPTRRVAASATTGEVPLNVCAMLGILSLGLLGLAAAAQIQGVWPGFLDQIGKDVLHYSVFGGVALIAIVTGILGIVAKK
jgi:hypothetical protein